MPPYGAPLLLGTATDWSRASWSRRGSGSDSMCIADVGIVIRNAAGHRTGVGAGLQPAGRPARPPRLHQAGPERLSLRGGTHTA